MMVINHSACFCNWPECLHSTMFSYPDVVLLIKEQQQQKKTMAESEAELLLPEQQMEDYRDVNTAEALMRRVEDEERKYC